ncbi:hypothetical protein BO82DRAFT_296616, partial [Aspergillus uvarum CBS 121591]
YILIKYIFIFNNLILSNSNFYCNLSLFSNTTRTKVAEVTAGNTIIIKPFYNSNIIYPSLG